MYDLDKGRWPWTDVTSPRRNNYFHGKLMDAYHFELETDYFNAKRWLLNRLIYGSGVVCGLDVYPPEAEPHSDEATRGHQIVIGAGVALDGLGREIIVSSATTVTIPGDVIGSGHEHKETTENGDAVAAAPSQADDKGSDDTGRWVHVAICYHECLEDPAPILAGDCGTSSSCEPGTIRESFSVIFGEGELAVHPQQCHIENVLSRGRINYETIVNWFTEHCPDPPEDPCVPLANIWISDGSGHACERENININVRPIVPSNLLLFEMFRDHVRDQGRSGGHGRRNR